jgi:two-component system cell cycle response regulator
MVDGDDAQVMAEWRHQKEDTHGNSYCSSIPTILVTMEPPPGSTLYYIKRPFVASRVINTLDQVTQRDWQGQWNRNIGVGETQKVVAEKAKTTTDAVEERKVYTALVVDDSSPVRKQIEIELRLFGIEVDTAATGEQAIELISNKDYSLIFLDVVLPGIDGYQTCKLIKKVRKKTPSSC